MRIAKKEIAFEGNHLRIVKKYFETDEGEEGIWETVERTNVYNNGAVVVVALTKKGEVILERNWRVPLESFVLQFPAGLVDREKESAEETAQRELLEETGYMAKRLIPVIQTPLSPDLTTTEAKHFFAPDVEFVGQGRKDAADKIEVLKVSVKQLSEFLLNLPQDTKLDLRVPGILWILEKRKLI
jgi:ADP-ribose pyrophosphatase